MSAAKIPVIVFVLVFVATLVLTTVVAHVYSRKSGDTGPQLAGTRVLPPFPNVAPLTTAPAWSAPPGSSVCVVLTGDERGAYVPAPLHPLTKCTSAGDCEGCTVSTGENVAISCQTPSAEVSAQQSGLDNASSKFCLPTPKTCISATTGLTACTHDSECAPCVDAVGEGQAMTCEIVGHPKTIALPDGGEEVDVPVGQWCLPKTGRCDSKNAVLQWTTDGWGCACRFPTIHGGEACDTLIACNNHLTTEWSAGNQQLLINRGDGEEVGGDVWGVESGINPTLCHVEGESDTSLWDRVCGAGTGTVPNAVCQCDGLMLGSHMGFRNEALDPLTCSPDNCSVNALGGRTSEPLTLASWAPGVAENQCVCSGADARIWDIDTRDPAVVEETDPLLAETLRLQQGYVYTGRCSDATIATNGAQVVLPADPVHAGSVSCGSDSNKHAEVTGLVPGFAVDATGSANVHVCAADPCRGVYSDINFQPLEELQYRGHYSADDGVCLCDNPSRAVNVGEVTEVTVNPVGSVCVDACFGMDSDNPEDWPCKQDPTRPCALKPSCITDDNGNPVCICAESCGNTDGFTCAAQFEPGSNCNGYTGVPNICATGDDGLEARCMCNKGKSRDAVGQSCWDTPRWYAMCTTSLSSDPSCHEGSVPWLSDPCGNQDLRCEGEPGCARTPAAV